MSCGGHLNFSSNNYVLTIKLRVDIRDKKNKVLHFDAKLRIYQDVRRKRNESNSLELTKRIIMKIARRYCKAEF